ncbi:McrB family protein [Priestia megaterium]|uniref:McrB family protein n=1 Tax=Priestia megaterium TaxID=1404 RepID=UPI001783B3B8|nr:AAA family ATPase [Priestia megaterium]MBD8115016.1 AAA family ATPase [Priestia megaterium]
MRIYGSNDLENISQSYVLGTLATNESFYPRVGESQDAVTSVRNGSGILFFIKALSPDPIPIGEIGGAIDTKLYIGFDNDGVGNFGPQYKYLTHVEQLNLIRTKLEGKLILFHPILKYDARNERYHKNLSIFSIEDDYEEGQKFIPLPRVEIDVLEFEQALVEGSEIEFRDYNHSMPSPQYIQCGDYIYTDFGEWKKHPRTNTTRTLISPKGVKKVRIEEEDHMSFVAAGLDYLNFFPIDYIDQIIRPKINEEGISYEEWNLEKVENEKSETNQENNLNDEENQTHVLEIEFLNAFERNALQNQLFYNKEDLINFHTSVKTNALNVLAGMSGTGKTQLAHIYAKSLGLSQEKKTLLILPISPSYTEPQDLIGHLNVSTGLYTPAETGLVDFLLHAEKNNDQMHILLMDEMNLSQVEHWFAPFISLLELKPDERILRLYSEKAVCHNRAEYPSTIRILDNICFVGTMNMDETTKGFSDRLLDRANIVIPAKRSFKETKEALQTQVKNKYKGQDEYEDAYGTFEEFDSWRSKKNSWDAFEIYELEFFDKLHDILNNVDPMKGFSFRNIVRMGDYLNHIPIDQDGKPMIDRKTAIDFFIKQRVLTKIRGPIETFEDLIGTQSSLNEIPQNSELYNHFTSIEAKAVSHFTETIKDIQRKAKELLTNGYAS